MDNIINWYHRNYTEITWFIIGFLVMAGFNDLGNDNYTGALISFALAYINYLFSKR